MRHSKLRIAVYSVNWGYGAKPLRHVKLQEAEDLIADGRAKRIGPKKGHFSIQLRQPERIDDRDHASITRAEMEANAFAQADPKLRRLTQRQKERDEENFYDVAASKVEEWPFVFDTLAPCVRPRMPEEAQA